jgi:hypothetical protein
MHSYCSASFFWDNEVEHVFKIKHVPYLDNSILSSAANQVVLIKNVVLVLLF